jgi:uncharacterized protein (DUF1697 family)
MRTFVALLRAVNVGGTGKLAMADLVKICEKAGFRGVTTYIQSGNVVLDADADAEESDVKATLEAAIGKKLGKPVGVIVRRPAELERVLADNPFPGAPPAKVIVMFYDRKLSARATADVTVPAGEELCIHGRELYVHYPDGQGRSKLKIPLAAEATGRNLNTLAKLAAIATRARG